MSAAPATRASNRFIALMAFLMSATALGIDAMLTSLPLMAEALALPDPTRIQLVVGVFVLSLGVGIVMAGPLSDAIGRRPVVLGGLALYALGAIVAWRAQSFEALLAGRMVQGLGAAAPRVVLTAIIRDRFSGRQMAATVSLVAMIFTLVPGVAPLMGAVIAAHAGWRGVFGAFVGFALIGAVWFFLQQPETLARDKRRTLRPMQTLREVREILGHRAVRVGVVINAVVSGAIFSTLSSSPLIFDQVFGIASWFPYVMGAVSLIGGLASLTNARLVTRLGMVRMIRAAVGAQCAVAVTMLLALVLVGTQSAVALPIYLLFKVSVFFVLGFIVGNSTALALQPLGHVAGTASALLAASSAGLGAAISFPISLSYNGTPIPLMIGCSLCSLVALAAALRLEPDAEG